MWYVGECAVDETYVISGIAAEVFEYYYEWLIDFYHSSGGKKSSWFFGMDNVPIESMSFEYNKHIVGAGDMVLNFVDFTIDANDRVKIWYKNNLVYQGIVDSTPDEKEGKIKLVPFSEQFSERIINMSFSSQTISNMMYDLVTEYDLGINWNTDKINIANNDLYTIEFKYKKINTCLDDLATRMNDREWGVDVNNNFCVYNPSTTLRKVLFQAEDKLYTEVETKNNNDKIKETRYYQVMNKGAGGKQVPVGNVGYDITGGTYPILSIEKIARRKDGTYTMSNDGVSSSMAKDFAYAKLQSLTNNGQSVKIKNVRYDKYQGEIGDTIRVVDDWERALITVEDCNSITDWTNAELYTDDYVSGSGCIQMKGTDPTDTAIVKDLGELKRFKNIDHLEFMIYSDEDNGNTIEMSLSNSSSTLFTNLYQIFIDSPNVWERKKVKITETEFRYIGFRLNSKRIISRNWNSVDINVVGESAYPAEWTIYRFDRIRIYGYCRNEYEGNIVQTKFKIDKKGIDYEIILNDYDLQANDELFRIQKEIENLKAIQTST